MALSLANNTATDELPPGASLTGPEDPAARQDDPAALSANPAKEGMYRFMDTSTAPKDTNSDQYKEWYKKAPVIYVPYSKTLDLLGHPEKFSGYGSGESWKAAERLDEHANALKSSRFVPHPDEIPRLFKDYQTDPKLSSVRWENFFKALPFAQAAIGAAKSATRTITSLDPWMEKHGPSWMTNKWFGLGESGVEDDKKLRNWAGTNENIYQAAGGIAEDAAELVAGEAALKGLTKLPALARLPALAKLNKSKRLWPMLRGGVVMAGLGAIKEDSEPSTVSAQSQDDQHIQEFKAQWDAMSPEEQRKYAESMTPEQFAKIAALDKPAQPSADSHHSGALAAALRALPAVSGNLGAWTGMVSGGALGGRVGFGKAGAVSGRMLGSGLGTAAGEALRQGAEHALGWDEGKYEEGDREKDIWRMGIFGAAAEGLSTLADKALTGSPLPGTKFTKTGEPTTDPRIGQTPERIANKLSYAGALEHGDPMEDSDVKQLLPKIIEKEKTNPVKDTKGLVNLYTKIKDDNEAEFTRTMATPATGTFRGQQVQGVPLGSIEPDPTPIVRKLEDLKNKYSPLLQQRRLQDKINAIDARIATYQLGTGQLPRLNYQDLCNLRIELNNNLRDFYAMGRVNPSAAGAMLRGNVELELDKIEADAIRDLTYNEMDTAAGLPAGTTRRIQAQRGAAINLERQTKEHLGDLATKSEHSAGASPLKRGNFSMYGTSHGRAGVGLHRLTNIFSPANPLADADKRAASAFGRTWPTRAGRVILAKPRPVMLPGGLPRLPVSLGTVMRDIPVYGVTPSSASDDESEGVAESTAQDAAQPQAQSLEENKKQADQQNPLKAMSWAHYATDPAGRTVVTNDPTAEQGWIYIDSGQPYKEAVDATAQ